MNDEPEVGKITTFGQWGSDASSDLEVMKSLHATYLDVTRHLPRQVRRTDMEPQPFQPSQVEFTITIVDPSVMIKEPVLTPGQQEIRAHMVELVRQNKVTSALQYIADLPFEDEEYARSILQEVEHTVYGYHSGMHAPLAQVKEEESAKTSRECDPQLIFGAMPQQPQAMAIYPHIQQDRYGLRSVMPANLPPRYLRHYFMPDPVKNNLFLTDDVAHSILLSPVVVVAPPLDKPKGLP